MYVVVSGEMAVLTIRAKETEDFEEGAGEEE
jgi:hypothetical protein